MREEHSLNVLLTGASGGIGSAIARVMAKRGHRLLLQGRNVQQLQQLQDSLPNSDRHEILPADLAEAGQRSELIRRCEAQASGVDVLINNAGAGSFKLLEDMDDGAIDNLLRTNLLVPMVLTRDLLPLLRESDRGAVVNIGSAFGHIGHPGFSIYGASKSGLHRFTEALRRELSDSSVHVHYLSPRAVATPFNSGAVEGLNRALGNKTDSPSKVARKCVGLLDGNIGRQRFIGWPERVFIKVNALFPSLVDSALKKKLPVIRRYASQNDPGPAPRKPARSKPAQEMVNQEETS